MLDLSKVPVGLTLTSRYAQIVENALAQALLEDLLPAEQVDDARAVLAHVHNCKEASMRKHWLEGVPPAIPSLRVVPAPVVSLPVRSDVA